MTAWDAAWLVLGSIAAAATTGVVVLRVALWQHQREYDAKVAAVRQARLIDDDSCPWDRP